MANYCKWVFAHFNFGAELDSEQNSKLLRIVAFILSVAMLLLIHLNPRAPEGPANMVFLKYLSLDFEVKDQVLAVATLKNVFVKHFVAHMNPANVALNAHFKHPAFHLRCLKDVHQDFPEKVDTYELARKRKPLRCFYTRSSKEAPCIKAGDLKFWNSVDHHIRTSKQYIGRMSQYLHGKKIRDNNAYHGGMKVDM